MGLSTVLSAIVLAIPVYFIAVTIYRLTFHPLARYPGPLLWRISGWPDGRAGVSGKRHMIHTQLHAKYGSVVRIAPNRISWNTAEAFHDIHISRHSNVVKAGFVGFQRRINDVYNLQQLPGKYEHQQRRKIVSHAFSDGAIKSAEDFMLTQVRHFTDALSKGSDTSIDRWSETKDMSLWANLLTMDIFGELCFGEKFSAMESGDHVMIQMILNGGRMAHVLSYIPISFLLVPILRTQSLLRIISPKLFKMRWAARLQLRSLIQKRLQAEIDAENDEAPTRKDIFHYVLKARDDEGNMLPLKNYIGEAVFLTAAGTDTTSTAMAATLFYLNRDPARMTKVREEVLRTFKEVEEIHAGTKLSSLTYLRACIDEALRMTPSVPGSLTRKALPGGTTVEGTHFPADIELDVPIYAMHHNESYFPDHSSFIPERWIPGSKTEHFEVTDELIARQRHAFNPFSSGPRNCLGMRMAYMEMGIVLARLIFLFDMRFDVTRIPTTKEFETLDWFICVKEGPYLQFRPRLEVKAE